MSFYDICQVATCINPVCFRLFGERGLGLCDEHCKRGLAQLLRVVSHDHPDTIELTMRSEYMDYTVRMPYFYDPPKAYVATGTVTGRIKSSNPNWSNPPRTSSDAEFEPPVSLMPKEYFATMDEYPEDLGDPPGSSEELEYFRQKLYAGLRIPKEYLEHRDKIEKAFPLKEEERALLLIGDEYPEELEQRPISFPSSTKTMEAISDVFGEEMGN